MQPIKSLIWNGSIMMKEKIKWTEEQEKLIDEMIHEAESIGYTQGWDDAIKEIIQELRQKVYVGESKDEGRTI